MRNYLIIKGINFRAKNRKTPYFYEVLCHNGNTTKTLNLSPTAHPKTKYNT